jgi:DNA helicase-2/ATP-dependent DNA helicase PcrA
VRTRSLGHVVNAAIEATTLDLSPVHRDIDALVENLNELRAVVRELDAGRATLRGLVDRLHLEGEREEREAGVNLLSLHAAKGLEYRAVFVIGLEEGTLPHRRALEADDDIEEERRLLYVGMTRARERLYLTHAHMRFLGGHASIGGASRFLSEVGAGRMRTVLSSRTTNRPRLTSVTPGDQVTHQRWGPGTVLSVEGRGRDTLTTIQFDSVGRQRLQLCHAPLTRRELSSESTRVG